MHPELSLPPAIPYFIWDGPEARMRVNEQVRKTVVFVGHETSRGFVPYGTGFLCSVPDPQRSGFGWDFVVTAQHVYDTIPGNEVSIRLNRHEGGYRVLACEHGAALSAKENDIALLPIEIDQGVYDFLCMPLNRKDWQERFTSLWEPGLGDEVCVSGLYTSHYGAAKNIPIVRVGHLAALPDEPVRTDTGYINGYLIEVHSIAGLSGSPVFVSPPPMYWDEAQGQMMHFEESVHIPIGMLIGHHVIETAEDEIVVPKYQQTAAGFEVSANEKNTGFGVVVPIERIFDMIESNEMQETLGAATAAERRKGGFKKDSATARQWSRSNWTEPGT